MAPSVWNSLPADLRNLPALSQFKSNLKTFLFTQAQISPQNLPVHPGFPADLVHLTVGYASVFVLFVFKCGEMYVERGDGGVA